MFQFARLAAVAVLFSVSALAQALVPITCDAGSSATCTYTDASGPHTEVVYDTNRDGKIEFTVPTGTATVKIGKHSDGRFIEYDAKPQATR